MSNLCECGDSLSGDILYIVKLINFGRNLEQKERLNNEYKKDKKDKKEIKEDKDEKENKENKENVEFPTKLNMIPASTLFTSTYGELLKEDNMEFIFNTFNVQKLCCKTRLLTYLDVDEL
jgi:hypothetical protein